MQSINVNIVPGDFPQILRYSQGDVGREFRINVVDFDIPTGATVTIVATKPSGFGFTASGTVTDNVVSFVTTEDMTDEYGKFPAEVRIANGTTLLGTANFMFIGEKNPHPDGTVDGMQGTIIPELTLLVNEIRESNAKVESMTASAVALPSGSDPTAEYDATDNNLEFGIPVVDLTDYATTEEVDEAVTDLRGELEEELDTKADAIIETASGSIASFTDGGDGLPMKSLKVEIVPKQSGSGDPSPDNVRPISGWSGVKIEKAGVNLLPNNLTFNNYIRDDSGNEVSSGSSHTSSEILVKPSTTYNIRGVYTIGIQFRIYFLRDDKTWISRTPAQNVEPYVFTTPSDCHYIQIQCYQSFDFSAGSQLELGSTATAYEPYQGESKYIPFKDSQDNPITVYGGEIDVVSGLLKSYPFYSSYNGETLSGEWICDRAVYSQGTTPPIGSQVVDMSGNGTEYQLEPTEIKTLKGSNNVWADTGDVEVEYRADTTLAFEKLKNAIVSLGGNI